LADRGVPSEITKITTQGDKILDVSLASVGGKGLFVKEIEEALLKKEIDLAVHSLKDMPALLPEGLEIAAVPKREDARDVLILRQGTSWRDLVSGQRVGTSSLRRQAQLKKFRPDLVFLPLRGNLSTRLKKMEQGEIDAVVLAAAGLHRMGWHSRISEYIPTSVCLPSGGQGALAIECRQDDYPTKEIIAFLNDPETAETVSAEREFLLRLGGGCQTPIAAFAEQIAEGINSVIHLAGLVSNRDGTQILYEKRKAPAGQSLGLGRDVAESLLSKGADVLLKAFLDEQGL